MQNVGFFSPPPPTPITRPLTLESKHQKQFTVVAAAGAAAAATFTCYYCAGGSFVLSGKKIRACVEQLARNCHCATRPLITHGVVGHVARFHYFYVYARVSSAAGLSAGGCRAQRAELRADAKKRGSADPLTDTVN